MLKADGNKLHSQGAQASGQLLPSCGSPELAAACFCAVGTRNRLRCSQQAAQCTALCRSIQCTHACKHACPSTQNSCVPATGRYTEAADKYARARDNLEGMTNSEAVQLRRACVLNLSSCYLNSKKYKQCVECCQEVLAGEDCWDCRQLFSTSVTKLQLQPAYMVDGSFTAGADIWCLQVTQVLCASVCPALCAADQQNLKALYRRGQAYAALHEYQEAEQDLQAAAELSKSDPQQLQLIKQKLVAVREKLASQPEPPRQQQAQQEPKPQPQERREEQQHEPKQQPAAQQEEQPVQQQEKPKQEQQQRQHEGLDAQADAQHVAAPAAKSQPQEDKQPAAKAAAGSMDEEDGLIEEIVDDRVPSSQQQPQVVMEFGAPQPAPAARSTSSQAKRAAAAAAASNSSRSAAAPPAAGGFGDMAHMQQMAEMMRQNPAMMRQVGEVWYTPVLRTAAKSGASCTLQ